MHCIRWLESTYSDVGEGKVLFSRNVKPGIFELGIALKEIHLVYSTQFVFLTIRLVPGNVVMVATDVCGIKPSHWEVDIWSYVKTCTF